ncbi:MAG: hypothetical protein ACRDT1_05695 [Micromonosporaceae bacterium]
MTSAVVQAPASVAIVVDALGILAPGWRDRTGISHTKGFTPGGGWTTVPMNAAAADRFAPLLARLLGTGVLRWETDARTCRVTYFQPDGDVIGPVDTVDTRALEDLAETFARRQVLHATGASGRDRSRLLGEASAASSDAAGRRRAFASVLGVPYTEPVAPVDSNPSTPVLSKAGLLSMAGPFQRRRRVEKARNIVGFAAYTAGVMAVITMLEPGWPINVIALALALALFGTRLWLTFWLRRMRREQQTR